MDGSIESGANIDVAAATPLTSRVKDADGDVGVGARGGGEGDALLGASSTPDDGADPPNKRPKKGVLNKKKKGEVTFIDFIPDTRWLIFGIWRGRMVVFWGLMWRLPKRQP